MIPSGQGVSTSPRISNVKWSSGTDSGPCWTVRTTHTGNWLPMVLKRSTLPVAQPFAPAERAAGGSTAPGRRVVGGAVGAGIAGGDHADVLADDLERGAVGHPNHPALGERPRLVTVIGYWVG